MRVDWKRVIVGSMMGVVVAGCASGPREQGGSGGGMTLQRPGDPDARSFSGTIVSWRPIKSQMVITKDEGHGKEKFPNFIYVKYDADTKVLIDGNPATLMDIEQYMPVTIEGHMREGQMFAEVARFSSALPAGVKREAKGE